MKCNRVQLADVLGVSLPTLDKRIKEWLPYVRKPGEEGEREWLFESAEVIQWMLEEAGGEKRDETADAKLQQLKAESGIKWMEFGEKKKALLHISDILPPIFEAVSIVKSRIQAVPGRLAQKVAVETDAAVCQRMLKEELDDALTALNTDFAEALRGE